MSADSYADDSTASEFWSGARASLPVVVAAMPFGLLFGALAIDNGFTVFEAIFMSATIYAGASQMVGVDLFGTRVAPWLIVLSIFAVNFRHVLYSATIGRHISHWGPMQQAIGFFFLVDPQFAEAERRREYGTLSFAWYMGMGLPIYLFWVVEAWLGALFGRLIPDPHAIGLDFLLPIYFTGLVMGFRKRSLWLPVVVVSAIASIVAYRFVGSPWHVSLGALAGILLGALMVPTVKKDAPR
ncbi:AzlC family ABC transporter permease [Nitratireductor thuwali]|uniref:Inner membrane protein YgaZ n=1 Tax=Nitratireductor thuwali TaxID=2267699 RepID=A0ABY5MG15_9HYPH|nr:Inner membrane protein YgaZ [Nitratireductor thuwali]